MTEELPKGWRWVKLDDALDYVIGGDWGKDENFEDSNYGLAYCIRGSEIKNWEEEKGRTASLRKIKHSNIQKRKLVEGDVLVEISGGGPEQPVGRTVLIDKAVLSYKPEIPKICTNFLRLIRPKDFIEGKFLNLYLKHFYYSGEIVKYQGGSNNLRNLKFPDYVKINIPLPPKPTQLAIVSKIEELFSEIENGIKSLFTAKEQLKKYRQSVLKWAFEGKLTNGLNGDLYDLYDEHDLSIAAEPETEYRVERNHNNQKNQKNHSSDKGELPEGWKWVKLGDVCDKIQDGSHFSPQVQYDEPGENRFKYITAKNIRNDYMDFRKLTYVDKDFHDSIYNRCNPEFGDVLLTKDGINTGEVTLNTLHEPFSLLSSVCIFKTKRKDLKSEYLKYFIQSPLGSKAILQSMTGTAIKRIVLKKIKESKITLPTIEEQDKIVQAIESRLSVADKMEESITQSLQQAEALKQSILKKSFDGKLV